MTRRRTQCQVASLVISSVLWRREKGSNWLATRHGHCLPQLLVDDSRFLLGAALNSDFFGAHPAILGAEIYALFFVVSEDRDSTRIKRVIAHPEDRTLGLNLIPASISRVLKPREGDSLCGRKACI